MKISDVGFISKLYSLLSEVAPTEEYFKQSTSHDSIHSKKLLEGFNMHYPNIGSSLLTLYFGKFVQRGIIPKPTEEEPIYVSENNNLRGKVVVITGASSGIGEETAVHLSKYGCLVALLARRKDKLTSLQDIIKSIGGKAIGIKTDISNEKEVETAIRKVETVLGPIDVLINCAGVMFYQHTYNLQISDCSTMIDVNIKGVILCTSTILPSMVKRKSGHIVNISSDAGKVGFPGLAVYSGTKFFVEGYSQALRKEVSQYNIRVTCIQPGDVSTPMQELSTAHKDAAKEYFPKPDSVMLTTKDVAKTIAFVLSCPGYMAVNEVLVEPTSAPI